MILIHLKNKRQASFKKGAATNEINKRKEKERDGRDRKEKAKGNDERMK